jgi:hypothetical protein
MATKEVFFRLGSFAIKDGLEILLWERWLGNTTVRKQYPALYYILHHKIDTIAKVMEISPPTMMFRRELSGHGLVSWNALLQRFSNVHLQTGHDEFW